MDLNHWGLLNVSINLAFPKDLGINYQVKLSFIGWPHTLQLWKYIKMKHHLFLNIEGGMGWHRWQKSNAINLLNFLDMSRENFRRNSIWNRMGAYTLFIILCYLHCMSGPLDLRCLVQHSIVYQRMSLSKQRMIYTYKVQLWLDT